MTDLRDADAQLLKTAGRRADAAALAQRSRTPLDPLQAAMGIPYPVWENATASKLPDGRCVLFSGQARCAATATHWAWIGCTIGEHLDKSGVCERHAEQMTGYPVLHCRRCWEATGEISDARVIKIERIEDGEKTAVPDQRSPGDRR